MAGGVPGLDQGASLHVVLPSLEINVVVSLLTVGLLLLAVGTVLQIAEEWTERGLTDTSYRSLLLVVLGGATLTAWSYEARLQRQPDRDRCSDRHGRSLGRFMKVRDLLQSRDLVPRLVRGETMGKIALCVVVLTLVSAPLQPPPPI